MRERTKQPHINQTVKGRRIQWAGYVVRMEEKSMQIRVRWANVNGRRLPGQPRKDCRRLLKEDIRHEGVNPRDRMMRAQHMR